MKPGRHHLHARTVATAVAAALAVGLAVAPRARAQEEDPARPTLADLMTLTQLRHFKVWYAQRVGNWPLVSYELGQFEQTIQRITKLYPEVRSISQEGLIREKTEPPIADLRRAIKDKDAAAFESAYMRLTNACNDCHRAANRSFILVQTPKRSPFSNQQFEPAR